MKMKRVFTILLVLIMITMFGACSGGGSNTATPTKAPSSGGSTTTTEAPKKTGVLTMGTIQDLSGSASVSGIAAKMGSEIAIEEINKAGGVVVGDTTYTVELKAYDCRSDPNEAISALKRLVLVDNAVIALGPPISGVGLAAAPYTTELEIPFLGQFANPACMLGDKRDTLNPYMFLMQPSSDMSGITAGVYMTETFGYKSVSFLIAQDQANNVAQANAFIQYCEDNGIEIKTIEYNKLADLDMRTQLTKIKESNPDFIFCVNSTQPLAIIMNQKYQLGIDLPITGSLDFSQPFADLVSTPAAASNVYFPSNVDYDDPEYVELSEKCMAKFGQEGTVKTALGYDQVLIAVAAIQKAGSLDRVAVRDALETISGVDTVITDNFSIDPKTHMPLGLEVCIYSIDNAVYKMEEWFVPDMFK